MFLEVDYKKHKTIAEQKLKTDSNLSSSLRFRCSLCVRCQTNVSMCHSDVGPFDLPPKKTKRVVLKKLSLKIDGWQNEKRSALSFATLTPGFHTIVKARSHSAISCK